MHLRKLHDFIYLFRRLPGNFWPVNHVVTTRRAVKKQVRWNDAVILSRYSKYRKVGSFQMHFFLHMKPTEFIDEFFIGVTENLSDPNLIASSLVLLTGEFL